MTETTPAFIALLQALESSDPAAELAVVLRRYRTAPEYAELAEYAELMLATRNNVKQAGDQD